MSDSYFGFISDGAAITSLTFKAENVAFNGLYPALDNLTVGQVGQVPEPASVMLLCLGLSSLLAFRRAR